MRKKMINQMKMQNSVSSSHSALKFLAMRSDPHLSAAFRNRIIPCEL